MNFNNLAQKTNYIAGSDKFTNIPFFLTSLNIPGLTLSHPELGARYSSRMKISADTVSFNSLSIEMLIDEDFKIYLELMDIINKNIKLKNGEFTDFCFDFWIEINNNKGNKLFKLEFTNCRIENIGDILLDSQDDITEHLLNLEMTYDYYQIEDQRNFTINEG